MTLPLHKTKIVCTIGPACSSETTIEHLLRNGMAVARINFAHGTLQGHREVIRRVRAVASRTGIPCMILGDLPGPKIRVGRLSAEPLVLTKGTRVVLSARHDHQGETHIIPVRYAHLAQSVSAGTTIYLNDGFIQLQVEEVVDDEVRCLVVIGGELLSFKGVNIPSAELDLAPITKKDEEAIECALAEGIDALSVSFVRRATEIERVKKLLLHKAKTREVLLVAKIETKEAIGHIDELLMAADAVMIARGDMGVQIPLEEVPAVQKHLIRKSNLAAKPVITATHMLASMTENIRPTRAEVSDVANAVLDGTDAVMLSEETAIGKYPVETVEVLSRILASAEQHKEASGTRWPLLNDIRKSAGTGHVTVHDLISLNAVQTADDLRARCIVVPTQRGAMPRRLSRCKPSQWVIALTRSETTRNALCMSYGVYPVLLSDRIDDDPRNLRDLIQGVLDVKAGDRFVVVECQDVSTAEEIERITIVSPTAP